MIDNEFDEFERFQGSYDFKCKYMRESDEYDVVKKSAMACEQVKHRNPKGYTSQEYIPSSIMHQNFKRQRLNNDMTTY